MARAGLAAAAMMAVAVIVPWLLAAGARWLPRHPATAPACAGLTLLACLSLPWTGGGPGPVLTPDPLGVHLACLVSFGWLAAALLGAPVVLVAGLAGALNLALLAADLDLTVIAAGLAGLVAGLAVRPRSPALLAAGACGLGLALFGAALLHVAAPAAGLGWAGLPEAARLAHGPALGVATVLILLGLATTCLSLPLWAAMGGVALPPWLAILAGPFGGVWLEAALRLRGVLDGNGHAIAPAWLLDAGGLGLLLVAVACIRRDSGRLQAGALLGVVGAAALGFGTGAAAGTAAALLHLTLGCLALVAVNAGGWAGLLGLAALVGIPPLGLFASAFGLLGAALTVSVPLGVAFALAELALVLVALRRLPTVPAGRSAVIGWVGLALAACGSWALPPGVAAWLLGIAAAAR